MKETMLASLGITEKHIMWFGYEWLNDDTFDPAEQVTFGGEWVLRDDRKYELRLIEIDSEFVTTARNTNEF